MCAKLLTLWGCLVLSHSWLLEGPIIHSSKKAGTLGVVSSSYAHLLPASLWEVTCIHTLIVTLPGSLVLGLCLDRTQAAVVWSHSVPSLHCLPPGQQRRDIKLTRSCWLLLARLPKTSYRLP